MGLLSKTITLHVYHAFLYFSLPSLYDYDVKLPNFTFYGRRKQAKRRRMSAVPNIELNSREIRRRVTFSANWNKHDKIWKNVNSFVTFSLPSPLSMLKLPSINMTLFLIMFRAGSVRKISWFFFQKHLFANQNDCYVQSCRNREHWGDTGVGGGGGRLLGDVGNRKASFFPPL